MSEMNLSKAIERTIAYAAKYGSKLTREEVYRRLLTSKFYSREQVETALRNGKTGGHLGKSETNQARDEKINKAIKMADKIGKIFDEIIFIGVTGSVAAGHPENNSDIDLMIICKKNSLWRCRLKLRWYIWKNDIPHRKYGQKEKKDDFCFNLWLDESELEIPKGKQNLKNAVDLILMMPLLNKEQTYERFVMKNKWAKKYVRNGYEIISKGTANNTGKADKRYSAVSSIFNYLAYYPQLIWIRSKSRNPWISCHKAFFHDN